MERVAKTPELEFVLDIEISKNCELIKVFLSMNSGWISNENNFFKFANSNFSVQAYTFPHHEE